MLHIIDLALVELSRRHAIAHDIEDHVGRIAAGHIREFIDCDAIDATLQRDERKHHGFGDEAGAGAGRID